MDMGEPELRSVYFLARRLRACFLLLPQKKRSLTRTNRAMTMSGVVARKTPVLAWVRKVNAAAQF
jgi:hypothetical protein